MRRQPPKPHRRTTALVALLLFMLATLAPGVSRAMVQVHGQVAPWAQICSTAAPASAPQGADLAEHMMDHCPLCALQADQPALATAAAASLLPLAIGHAVPALFLHAPRPLFAWAARQARGPPQAV